MTNLSHRKEFMPKTVSKNCEQCGVDFEALLSNVRRGYGRFCSRDCYGQSLSERPRVPATDRFWAQIDRSGNCWEWQSHVGKVDGYGRFGLARHHTVLAHRYAYELTYGAIPKGLHVCHRCDNRKCVRPDHLFLGDDWDNMGDCAAKDRIAHGERSASARLTADQVRIIRQRRAAGAKLEELACEFSVRRSTIADAVHGRTWRRV